jgi:hypothetical protein
MANEEEGISRFKHGEWEIVVNISSCLPSHLVEKYGCLYILIIYV